MFDIVGSNIYFTTKFRTITFMSSLYEYKNCTICKMQYIKYIHISIDLILIKFMFKWFK